jgi:nucleoside-diphosphate-sugar epimerase
MQILVTGGLGFVGINLVRDLAVAFPEAVLIAADRLMVDESIRHFFAPMQDRVQIELLDIRDRQALDALVNKTRATHIIHAAAVTPDEDTEWHRSPDVVDVNLVGAVNALRAAYLFDFVEKFVFISSSGVYGRPEPGDDALQHEDKNIQLDHLYGISKYSIELLTERYALYTGKPMASLRLASMFGPMERNTGARTGMSQPRRLMNALLAHQPLKAYGPHIRRDWMYTADLGLAVAKMFKSDHWQHAVYNAGTGEAITFGDLISVFERHGLPVHWVQDPALADFAMQSDNGRQALDITRLKSDFGYQPKYTGTLGVDKYIEDEISAQKGNLR